MNNFSKWKRTLFWFFYSPHHQLLQFPVNFLGRHHHFYFGGGQQRRSRLGQLVATTIKWQILYNSKEFINLPPGNLLLVNWVTFESWHFYKVIVILGWITTLLWLPNSMDLQYHWEWRSGRIESKGWLFKEGSFSIKSTVFLKVEENN